MHKLKKKGYDYYCPAHGKEHKKQSSHSLCKFPGCVKPCFVEKNGTVHEFCGRTHAKEFKYSCLKKDVPFIRILTENDPIFRDIQGQFKMKWKKKEYGNPTVKSIVAIEPGTKMKERYEAYRNSVICLRPNLKIYNKGGPGNEQRRFHGTKQLCNFGLSNNSTPCDQKGCEVCSIIKNGWSINQAGTSKGYRFGQGAYFSSCSSKSHDYNEKSERGLGPKTRSMFLASVIVGNAHILTTPGYKGSSPPNGFDSIIADKKKTPNVNYDELIIFNAAAALPTYLIVYGY